jgi:type IV fimbrial biogenesis protein FimT
MKRYRGFTLIELMVTLLVAGIMLAWGVPSFLGIIENNRVATQANTFVAALALARSEAVSKGVTTHVSTIGADWSQGWRVWADQNDDGAFQANEELRVFDALKGQTTFVSVNGISDIPFDSKGYLNVAAGTVYQFEMKSPKCTGLNARDITVTAVGRPTIERVACP